MNNTANVAFHNKYNDNGELVEIGTIWYDELIHVRVSNELLEDNIFNTGIPQIGETIQFGPYPLLRLYPPSQERLDQATCFFELATSQIEIGKCYHSTIESNWKEWRINSDCKELIKGKV